MIVTSKITVGERGRSWVIRSWPRPFWTGGCTTARSSTYCGESYRLKDKLKAGLTNPFKERTTDEVWNS